MHDGLYSIRLKCVMAITVLLWMLLWGRVGMIQGLKSDYYRDIKEDQHVKPITLTAKRGSILDRNGVTLATDVLSASYEIRPREVAAAARSKTAQVLSRATGISESSIRSMLASDREYCWLVRQVDPEMMRTLDALNVPGLRKIREYRRSYPGGTTGAQLLGYCDVDGKGIEGCELFANDTLTGHDGISVTMLDALGRTSPSLDKPTVEPEDGNDVTLTIDRKIQEIADEELEECVRSLDAVWGGAIVLDPGTGEILAISNVPRFDPNRPSSFSAESRRNRIVTDMVEPGSTFKIVTFIEALESGVVKEDDMIDCENGSYKIGRHTIDDSHKLGLVTVRETMVHSSNIGTVKIADKLGKQKVYERARLLGFGTVTGFDVPDESSGKLPNPKTWSKLSLPTISFGHGVAVSPIQLAMAYAAVANGGCLLRPRLIGHMNGKGERKTDITEKQIIRRVMKPETANRVENLLAEVVNSGTGQTAKIANITIAGKTGTAQRIREEGKGYAEGKYISSFIGYVVDREPKILCLVMIDSPKGQYYGSQVAAPAFRKIINRILNMGDSPVASPVLADENDIEETAELTVPDLEGKDVREAVMMLAELGFTPSVSGDSTKVSRQMPQAGAVLNSGACVTIYSSSVTVEKGNRIRVPKLTGKTVREAVQHLNEAQLEVTVSGTGVVRKQNPPAGTLVEYGTVCMIICEKR